MVVVDTNVFSYTLKSDTRAEAYRPHLQSQILVLSFMSVAELERWAMQANWGARKLASFETALRRYIISSASRDVCKQWAFIMDNARRIGRPIAVPDAWIAATALHYGVPLVTHNAADYVGVPGLTVITESS